MKFPLPTLIILLIPYITISQSINPEKGIVYCDTLVPRIDITIHPDTLNWIYENVESDIEFHASFVFNDGNVIDSINPVGFRLRGNTSRYSQKKSFKVSFNTWTDSGNYQGIEKLNLNGEHNDPSIMRAKLMWDFLYKWGIPAPRANHVELYINGNYHGLYLNVEHIDEEFMDLRFGNKNGNIYKCLYPADLDYLGSDPDLYKLEENGRRVYELKRNEEADDYSDLANFISILNNSDDASFSCEIDQVFNTTDYLKVIAADILCGNWDGYIFNKNNYYLYHNEFSDHFEFLIYDPDNTFGIDWYNIDWANRNPYNWEMDGNEKRPLYTRIMEDDILRKQFTWISQQLINQIDMDSLIQSLQQRQTLIAPFVINDPFYPLDYGYTFNDFERSLTEVIGDHVKTSVFGFLTNRFSSMQNQLENTQATPLINHINHTRLVGNRLFIGAWADAQFPFNLGVQLVIDEDISDDAVMFDDGQHSDGAAGDLYYGAILENIFPETSVLYHIVAIDTLQQTTIKPCDYIHVRPLSGDRPLLFINEFMADNDHFNTDEYGNYSDWIELYNGDTEAIFLADYFLTDKLDNPDKWQMPEVFLQPGAFILFWADDEENPGERHTNFKLSKDGESIGIFNGLEGVVDTLTFSAQTTDVSYGRETDGALNWTFFEQATPGESNEHSSLTDYESAHGNMIYPNPVTGGRIYFKIRDNFKLYDLNGKLIHSSKPVEYMDVSWLPKSLYLLKTKNFGSQLIQIN
jgi:hypothetical protein